MSLHSILNISERAETFSEEYFRELYDKDEAQWVEQEAAAHKINDVEQLFPEDPIRITNYIRLNPKHYEKYKIDYYENRENYIKSKNEPFNPEHEKVKYKTRFEGCLSDLKSKLPEYILKKVADIRVLTLHYVSEEVMTEIRQYCENNETWTTQRRDEYLKEYKKTFGDNPPTFIHYFGFHDCKILSCYKQGNNLVIEKDNSVWNIQIDKVIFKNCTVIEQEGSLIGARWINNEIYRAERGYEIHVLLEKGTWHDLSYLTLIAEDVEYIK
jgi:hypothetical protein